MNVKLISLPCICRDEHRRAPENEASIKLLPCILPSNCYHAYTTFIFMCIHKLLCNFLQWLDCFTYTPSILCLINFVIVLSVKPVKSVDASQP